ncbi:hypothetical protein SC171_21510 [Pantoea cypripedii]|uniref:hypothetical protein n=1 Tax=Pantoea cypripedii TaxID=55209 RepID=UPI002FCA0B97
MIDNVPVAANPSLYNKPVLSVITTANKFLSAIRRVEYACYYPLTCAVRYSASWFSSLLINFIPRAVNVLNQRANKILITPEQIFLLQSWLRDPDQQLAEILHQHIEPLMAVLAEELLEKPALKLLGGTCHQRKGQRDATSNDKYQPFIDITRAKLLLSQPGIRELLSQLYILPNAEEPQFSSEFLRLLGLLSGGGADPLQLNNVVFDQLEARLIQANIINPGTYPKEVLLEYLTRNFSQRFFSSEMLSRILIKHYCMPAVKIPDVEAVESAERQAADINLPRAAVLRTLQQSATVFDLAPETETVLLLPQCPTGKDMSGSRNVTGDHCGIVGSGYGSSGNNDTLLYMVNAGNNTLALNLRSPHQTFSFSSLFHPGNRLALTASSSSEFLPNLQYAPSSTAKPQVAVSSPSEPLPMGWLTWLDQLIASPLQRLGVEGSQNGVNLNRLGHHWYKRDVSVQRHPAQVIPRAEQYDVLPARIQPQPTITTLPADIQSAAKAVNHWLTVITEAPSEQIEAGFERYHALRNSRQSLREIGLDPWLRETTASSLADRIKSVLQVLDKILLIPSGLNQTEFAILQNDLRSGLYEGLPILSGGELLTRLAILAEITLPLLDSLFWQKPKDFAGFAAINTKINSQLPSTGLPDITVHHFFELVEQQKDLFCRQLGQQHEELSAQDITHLRALLSARLQKDYPILRWASNPLLRDKRCFDELGIRLSLAAAVVAESQCRTITLPIALQIAQHLLLSQPLGSLRMLLGQSLYIGDAAGESRIKTTLQQEAKRLLALLEFTRSRRALDKLLMQPLSVDPLAISAAREEFREASRQFYASALLSLPQSAQEWLAQHFRQTLTATLIQISLPGEQSAHKPCLGIIIQAGDLTYIVSPFLRISDATEKDIIDFTTYAGEKKRALSKILLGEDNTAPGHELTLTDKPLSFRQHHGGLWNQLLAEEIVACIVENSAVSLPPATSTTTTSPADPTLPKIWRSVDSILGWTNYRFCLEILDDVFSPDSHRNYLELAGTGAMCLETVLPEADEANLLMTVGETVTGKVLGYIKNGKAASHDVAPTDNAQAEDDEELIKWEDEETTKAASLNEIYSHAGLSPWLMKPLQPSTASLSTAAFRPQQNSKVQLDNLAGYATDMTQREEGRDYLSYQYGEEEIYYEVESQSISSSGDVFYRIPAGAPPDRIVSVTRDEQGGLNVVANNAIKISQLSENATSIEEVENCRLEMPENLSPGENFYVSLYNDNRLVIEVKDREDNVYLREVNEAGEFVPWEPTLFPAVSERTMRSIDNEPSSTSSIDLYGRYGLKRISDRKRRERLIVLYQHRKNLMQFSTGKELKIDIIWQANEVKKSACYQAMVTYLASLPVNDTGRESYTSLLRLIDSIASGEVDFINPPLDPAKKSYIDYLQIDINARKGLANIIAVFELPGSDHTLTRSGIDEFKDKAGVLINSAGVFSTKMAAFNKARNDFSHHRSQYGGEYKKFIFKRESIISMFFYGSRAGLTRSETVNNIKYVAMGETIEDKFPRLSRDLKRSREYGEKQIEMVHEAMRIDRGFINREMGKMFHVQEGYVFNTTLCERILVALNKLLENHSEEEIRIFKDYSKYNPLTNERKLLVLNTYLERKILPYSGVLGQSSPANVEVEPVVGISCSADGSFKTVLATYLHELFHFAIPGIIPKELDIEDEIYVNFTDRVNPLSQQEQSALLHKIMSSPNVFAAYIKDEPEYLRAFVHVCRYSSNQEQVTLAKELRSAWREPLTQVMLIKVDRLIQIMFDNPQLKLDLAVYFPDFTVAMLRWLAEKAQPVIQRDEAPSDNLAYQLESAQ